MNHKWKLVRSADQMRYFECEACGAGPVGKSVFNGKSSTNAAAKRAGISPDCNVQKAKDVIES